MNTIKERDENYVAGTYKRFPVALVRGEGSLLYSDDGKRYIDMGSGIGVTAFGAADAEWVRAVSTQAATLAHTSNLYYTEPCSKLAELLCQRTGMKKVFFSNSGAEANECAIKVARKYAAEKHGEDTYTIVTLENSFHGRTLTTLAATGQDHYHELFQPLTPGFVSVPAGDIEKLEETLKTHKVAAILMECVQGEGGVIPVDPAYAAHIGKVCKERDILLLIDEVQTGNGRTGTLFAYMQYGLTPDVVSTAKGIGGGLPLGATLLGEKAKNVLGYGDHGSTFGGNPVSCAGALSVFGRMDDAFLREVGRKSRLIFDTLEGKKGIKSVSGLGLMIGIETEKPAAEVVAKAMEMGVLCLTAKHKVRLLPALNIPDEILTEALSVLLKAAEM